MQAVFVVVFRLSPLLNMAMYVHASFLYFQQAYHTKTDRTMILKKDKENFEDTCFCENSLMNEAEILSQINHPNVVRFVTRVRLKQKFESFYWYSSFIRFLGLCIGDLDNQVHLLIEVYMNLYYYCFILNYNFLSICLFSAVGAYLTSCTSFIKFWQPCDVFLSYCWSTLMVETSNNC